MRLVIVSLSLAGVCRAGTLMLAGVCRAGTLMGGCEQSAGA
jgi:hypothetical protein